MRRAILHIVHDDGVLTKEAISKLLVFDCQASRLSYACPNKCCCGRQFMRGEAAFLELVQFRHKFWGDPELDSRCDDRRERLNNELSRLVSSVDGSRVFAFTIGAVSVCKSFYRAATGLPRQIFDSAVTQIVEGSGGCSRASTNLKPRIGETEAFVLGFLDAYFSGFRIQHDPVSDMKAMVYSSWLELYQNEFKLHSRLSQRNLISYPRFCSIRQRHRKGYTIARVYRKRGKC